MLEDFLKKADAPLLAAAALLLVMGCSAKAPVVEKTAWKAFMYDGSRSNHSRAVIAPPLKRLWKKNISPRKLFASYPELQTSAPVLSGGVLYVGSANKRFYAFNYRDGKLLWSFDSTAPIEASATVADGRVCFGSADGVMRCLDASTGAEVWSFQAQAEILSAPVIKDGALFFHATDDKLYGLDAITGEKLWTYTRTTSRMVTPRVLGSPASSGRRLFQLFSDGSLVCLDSVSGSVLWEKKIVKSFAPSFSGYIRRTPLVYNGRVHMIDDEGRVLALDEEDGKLKGIYSMLKATEILVIDNRLLIIAGEKKVLAFEKGTDSILWKRNVEYSTLSSIFAVGDYIFLLSRYEHRPLDMDFFASDRGYIRALSTDSGELVWEKKFKSTITANASGADGAVALFMDNGVIGVFASK
jgi:outer membrane protein assembly factor BamB